MRTRPLTVTATALGLGLALAGCGNDPAPSATAPKPTPAAISAEACRAYDSAISAIADGLDGDDGSPLLYSWAGPDTVRKIDTAAQLADGPARAAIQRTALRVQVLADKDPTAPEGVSAEAAAVRSSISEVDTFCRAAGASLGNVPAPVSTG